MKIDTTSRNVIYFVLAVIFQLAALLMMAFDAAPHGLGVLTLWIAPVVLIIGLALPAIALIRFPSMSEWINIVKDHPLKMVGFLTSILIAFVTYLLTLEPTASLWDCSETIAAAYKLQVPHTPGTPLTLLLGRLFSMLAFGDVAKVAWYINLMSGFFSALAVGIVFLITWYFGERLLQSKVVLLMGSLGGALSLGFSDSFWFSAVEAETYGPSVFFMVFLIWLTIQGSGLKGSSRKNRIFLISYLFGLAFCIHPMSILILPVCFIIWRSANHQQSWSQMALSFGLGLGFILMISRVVAVGLFEWAFQLDLFLVNEMSMPFYSGILLLIGLVVGISLVLWKRYPQAKVSLIAVGLIIAGFSPYFMLFVRSSQLPSINEFTPNNLAKIKPYMNRESYPGRPLLYGPYFDAKIDDMNTKAFSYIKEGDHYQKVGEIPEYHYEEGRQTFMPRIYSNDPAHVQTYQQWTGLQKGEKPKFSDNLRFMIQYQLGHMFGRYLLWNFAGRVSDIQHADWVRPLEGIADRSAISYNRANNQYFMLPLLFGLIGLLFQSKRDRNGWVANMAFFLITGLILTIYLNGTPNEPRERDYIYVGSYVAFTIWIGLGIMAIGAQLQKWRLSYLSGFLLLLPVWMLYQNWDDHDRSGRTFQMDYARSVLNSCEPGAVLFTGGDNDTFPLWYLQEVEGFRTDVRVKVLSYFNADWYINQLSRQYYDSPPLKLTLKKGENQYGPYDPVYIQERFDKPIDWGKYMQALKDRNPKLMFKNGSSELFFLPSRNLKINISEVELKLKVSGSYLPKSEMAILDIIQSNDWERPVYFNFTSINSLHIDLKSYVVNEGLVYKLTPERHHAGDIPIDLERAYQNMVVDADYSNLSNPEVYFNYEDYQARMIDPLRFAFNTLINGLFEQGNEARAKDVIQFAIEHFYSDHLKPSYAYVQMSQLLASTGRKDDSKKLLKRVYDYYQERIRGQLAREEKPERNDVLVLGESVRFLGDSGSKRRYNELIDQLKNM